MLEPTFAAFPQDPATKDAAGVPFGCVAQPLAPFTDDVLAEDELEHADAVARCETCLGYISSHCQFLRHHWRCSLCGTLSSTPARYTTARRNKLPELADAAVELRLGEATAAQPPLCLVLVDDSGDDDFLEVARAALHAAVAALCESAPATLFGIIAFSDTVALHLLSSSVPHVRHVPLPADGEPSMPLLHAAPWSRLLTAAGSGAARIGAAIETLRPAYYDGSAPAVHQRRCGLGPALRATLEAVGGGGGGFGSARLLLLLGGPPNYGDGKLASSRAPSEALAAAAAAARRPAAGLLDVDVEEGGVPGGAAGGGSGGGGEGAEDADRALLRPPRGARPCGELTTHYSRLTTHC
eukprot:scaffold34763_cov82-Phaeocystis_antarctica.AAC.12